MKKWLLTKDDRIIEYDRFLDAKSDYLDQIIEFMMENKKIIKNGIPKSVIYSILDRYDSDDLKDEEILTYERLKILLSGLLRGDSDFSIDRSYFANTGEENNPTIIKIVKDEEMIFIDLEFDIGEYYRTNSFNINDDTKYYFEAKLLGEGYESIDSKIYLEPTLET